MGKRRIIGISTIAVDASISLRTFYIDKKTREELNTYSRRISRTPTLDGAAVIYDAGYAVADKTIYVRVQIRNESVMYFFAWLVAAHNLIRICTDNGVYEAAPAKCWEENGYAILETLVTEQIA
jgi:hypothetical protein